MDQKLIANTSCVEANNKTNLFFRGGIIFMMLSTKELQTELRIGRDKAYALMHNSAFPSLKIGGRYYVPEAEL